MNIVDLMFKNVDFDFYDSFTNQLSHAWLCFMTSFASGLLTEFAVFGFMLWWVKEFIDQFVNKDNPKRVADSVEDILRGYAVGYLVAILALQDNPDPYVFVSLAVICFLFQATWGLVRQLSKSLPTPQTKDNKE